MRSPKIPFGILFGPNGVGKGTLAHHISEIFGYKVLNMGNIIREYAYEHQISYLKDIMDNGEFVEDEIVEASLIEKLEELRQSSFERPLLFDGFPRRKSQMAILHKLMGLYNLEPEWIIVLNAPLEEILDRVTGRVTAPDGQVYHLTLNPPPPQFKPEELITRPDDRPDIVKKRYKFFMTKTLECIGDQMFLDTPISNIDSRKPIPEVYKEAENFLKDLK